MYENKNNQWMKALDNNARITSISIPGTHDSGTQFCAYKKAGQCQDASIRKQLLSGYRFLDIRLCLCGEKMIVVHGHANCHSNKELKSKLTFDRVLTECYEFLEHNPTETIFMSIKKDRGFGVNEFARNLLEQHYKKKMGRWFLENRNPLLKEVRGKIVLLRRYKIIKSRYFSDNNSGINLSYWPDQKNKQELNNKTFEATRFDKKDCYLTANVQDRYMVDPETKWKECILPTLETPPEEHTLRINFLSSAYKLSPKANAKVINEHFKKYDLASGKNYGIVVADFADKEIAQKIFSTNNFVE